MDDRPIIFSAPMVLALLARRKVQTRRLLKKPAALDAIAVFGPQFLLKPGNVDLVGYLPGARLYVREAHTFVDSADPGRIIYRADDYETSCERHGFYKPYRPESAVRWRPSIHMPRWASRLTLTVTDVRVQRLQEISEEDAWAEGAVSPWSGSPGTECDDTRVAREEFAALWNTIHGPDAWLGNPWVVALTFTVENRNIDQ